MDWLSEPMLALYGTIFGGVGLKLVEAVLGRGKRKADIGIALRTELRQEMQTLREEALRLKKEADEHDRAADEWRTRYFSLIAAVASKDENAIKKHFKA